MDDEKEEKIEEVKEIEEKDEEQNKVEQEESQNEEENNDEQVEQNEQEEKSFKYEVVKRRVITKENLYRVITFAVLAIVVIASFSIAGIFYASSVNKEDKDEAQEEEVAIEEETKNTKIPVYSEEAKERMKHIYEWTEGEEKIAYLTFDDGPSANVTPQILDILKNEGIKATFFVLGSRVELNPELVKREYEEGHYIANHGYSHVYTSVYASPQAVLDEYNNTENKIKEAIGNNEYSSHLFRFPGGSEGGKYANIKNTAKSLLEENDISHINWNALTNDSVGTPTYESLVQDLKITSNGKNKIVVLMHDTGTKQLTADTLLEIINYLREQGYSFKNFYDIMY